jgi:hypothetical protein
VAAELREVLGEGDARRLPTFEDYPRLQYTVQVIKETLRLYPSIPLFPRKVESDDVLPGGYKIPGGDGGCADLTDFTLSPLTVLTKHQQNTNKTPTKHHQNTNTTPTKHHQNTNKTPTKHHAAQSCSCRPTRWAAPPRCGTTPTRLTPRGSTPHR